MSKTDPGWIFVIIIGIVIALIWKPVIAPQIQKMRGAFQDDEQVARGKAIFEDANRWGASGVSCATCHMEGSQVPSSATGTPLDFGYVPINGVYKKYVKGALANEQELATKINLCITLNSRLNSPTLTTTNVIMQDLVAYLKTLR